MYSARGLGWLKLEPDDLADAWLQHQNGGIADKDRTLRKIDDRFIDDLREGDLSVFLDRVKADDNLCLEVRNNHINIYYRGGNLLKISQAKSGYLLYFNPKYCLNKGNDDNYELLSALKTNDIDGYAQSLDLMLSEMDDWLEAHPKPEREFQHDLVKSNLCIVDIEYQTKHTSRLDMILFSDNNIIIVENKLGKGVVSGKAGIAKHYKDMCDILNDDQARNELIRSVANISAAKYKLGLLDKPILEHEIHGIEILFLLAEYSERSMTLQNEIIQISETFPAKILFMGKGERLIHLEVAEDLMSYGR